MEISNSPRNISNANAFEMNLNLKNKDAVDRNLAHSPSSIEFFRHLEEKFCMAKRHISETIQLLQNELLSKSKRYSLSFCEILLFRTLSK
jgi:hypothetical protein